MEGVASPPGTTRPHTGPPRDVAGPICIGVEALMVLANILPIVVVSKYKHSKERITTDIIILALSVTDILSVVVPAPFGLPAYFLQKWHGGAVTCYLYQLTSIWFQLASMCLVTFMCLDRWCALRRAINHRHANNNITSTRAIIAGIYVITLCVAALPIMGLAPKAISSTGLSCRSWVILTSQNLKEHVFYIAFLILGFSNLIVAIVINTHVISTLISLKREFGRTSADRRINNTCAGNEVDHRSIVEITTMAAVVTIIFYLAWLPVLVLITLQKIGCNVGGIAVLYALLSTTLTGILNPVLYAAFSRSYRNGYISVLKSVARKICCCCYNSSGLKLFGAKDAIQWQMVNTVSNTSSLLGLLSNGQPSSKTGNDGKSNQEEQEITDIDDSFHTPDGSSKSQTQVVIEKNYTRSDDGEGRFGNHGSSVVDANGDVIDSGVFERTYFDETLENDDDDDYDHNADVEDFYGSKLSLLSSNDEEEDTEVI